MVDPRDDPIELVPSRFEHWLAAFEGERDRVTEAAASRDLRGQIRRIEHVGSTAIPGLCAKDIVDLDIVMDDSAVDAVSRAIAGEVDGTRCDKSDQ